MFSQREVHFGHGRALHERGHPTKVKQRMMTIGTIPPRSGDGAVAGAAAVNYSDWLDGTANIAPIPISVPGYPQPVGWLWGQGVVTAGPLVGVNPTAVSISVGPVTMVDPTTGRATTTTGTVDLQSGGAFTIAVEPGDDTAMSTVDIPTGGSGGSGPQPTVDPYSLKTFGDISAATGTLLVNPTGLTISGSGGIYYFSAVATVTNAGHTGR